MAKHHGKRASQTYACWRAMMARCHNPNATNYKYYGAKGVMVHEAWRNFQAFQKDMGECPEGHTLDRFPNGAGNYEPGNCRWATMAEQNANRSICIQITRDGITKTATEWARHFGLKPSTVIERLRRGYSHEDALSTADLRRK